jgi:CRISPR/Cas system CMR subunit Cmr6 (Cas7 group RAMP superfamily)
MGNGPLERKLQFEKKNQDLVKLPKRTFRALIPSLRIILEMLEMNTRKRLTTGMNRCKG